MTTVIAAVVLNGDVIAICEDGSSWQLVVHSEGNRWEQFVKRIHDFL